MTHPPVFKGVATALATPFYKDGIDWTAFGRLIEFQLAHGVDALVVCGTTGESATLSDEEQAMAVDFCVRQTRGRVPVIAGAGSNDTRRACRLAERAAICGADAILAVTPYYNKATASGLFEHYRAICESSEKPVIVYNVPSRTGVNITPEQYARLCELPGVAGIKEADADIEKTVRTLALCREKTYVYCGNDTLFLPFLALGGAGAVSVISNAAPMRMKKLYSAFAAGDIKTALRIQD
ncbi:MAG: 4-hydroxy-tetrahydrodipicolinate synthase, partial [Clostridia bacterium]|nr:4-hydroxy-tetrahydrodipicolinate synthase [Clostridia bacterium]